MNNSARSHLQLSYISCTTWVNLIYNSPRSHLQLSCISTTTRLDLIHICAKSHPYLRYISSTTRLDRPKIFLLTKWRYKVSVQWKECKVEFGISRNMLLHLANEFSKKIGLSASLMNMTVWLNRATVCRSNHCSGVFITKIESIADDEFMVS